MALAGCLSCFCNVIVQHLLWVSYMFPALTCLILADSLYLGNPMDPPDVLGLDLSAAQPTQLAGRAKSE